MDKGESNDNIDGFGFNFIEVVRILDRQKKIFYAIALITLSSGFIHTLFNRINNPVYKGYFSMLVEDPFKKNEENSRGNNFIEDIASYNTKNDIPTIIEVLKSKPILSSASKANKLPYKDLLSSLVITKGGNIKNIREEAKGILEISYYGKDKSLILSVLNDLSRDYIAYSLKQKKDRIKEGLEFLNSQNPDLQKNIDKIQLKLKNLRTNSSPANPQKQADLFNQLVLELDNEKKNLEIQLESFSNFKEKIKNEKNYDVRFEDSI